MRQDSLLPRPQSACVCLSLLALSLMLFLCRTCPARADDEVSSGSGAIELGDEYTEFSKTRGHRKTEHSLGRSILLYIPNRVLDFIDIFRVDVGVGGATGAVVRVTKWGQAGMRVFTPASLRLGLRGRNSPIFLEHTSEFGVGPLYVASNERQTTPAEVGFGVDLFVVGGYAGVSLDGVADFVLGFFGLDLSDDDLE